MSIILFLVILIILVVIHELGHFSVAKYFGIRVDEFGIGFPPKLWGIQKGETVYSINAIPFGGFVKIFGENPDQESISGTDSSRSMVNKPKWVQVAVLAAGVTFNAVFAWLLISLMLMLGMPGSTSQYGRDVVTNPVLTITAIAPESPAQIAGIHVGDTIKKLSVVDEMVQTSDVTEAQNFIERHATETITLQLLRGTEEVTVEATPVGGIVENKRALGIGMESIGIVTLPIHTALWEGLNTTVRLTISVVKGLGAFFIDTLFFRADLSQVTGPVGIVNMVGEASKFGILSLLSFTAFISINLAVINLLPFPALDGGRILLVIIEKIKGSAISPTVANSLNAAGFLLLILLMLVVTFHDVWKLLG